MSYAVKVLADSIAEGAAEPVRLISLEVTCPRFILAEFNTHRMFSRNSASSRAIPVEKRIQQVRDNPFIPEAFGKNQRGMQAGAEVDAHEQAVARMTWLAAAKDACASAEALAGVGVHKQHANRLLEPFCWHTMVVTATDWANFFALRDHAAAQPEMRITARLMREAIDWSTPRPLLPGDWHLPYIDVAQATPAGRPLIYSLPGVPPTMEPLSDGLTDEEVDTFVRLRFRDVYVAASVVRCAAVSYLRHDAERPLEAIQQRHNEMRRAAHWSPFEHQACVASAVEPYAHSNFRAPWVQYRKFFFGEAVFRG